MNKITYVDKIVISLVSYKLPFTLYPWPLVSFVVGGDQCHFLFSENIQFLGRLQLHSGPDICTTFTSGWNIRLIIPKAFLSDSLAAYTKPRSGTRFALVSYPVRRLSIFYNFVSQSTEYVLTVINLILPYLINTGYTRTTRIG